MIGWLICFVLIFRGNSNLLGNVLKSCFFHSFLSNYYWANWLSHLCGISYYCIPASKKQREKMNAITLFCVSFCAYAHKQLLQFSSKVLFLWNWILFRLNEKPGLTSVDFVIRLCAWSKIQHFSMLAHLTPRLRATVTWRWL